MEKKYVLTYTEMEIMEFLWQQKSEVTFKEIMVYMNEKLHKDWKRQTLSTYLKNLQIIGLVKAVNCKRNYSYYATCTKEEHVHNWTKDLIKKSYGTIEKFMIAFSGGNKLNKEDADRLRKLL